MLGASQSGVPLNRYPLLISLSLLDNFCSSAAAASLEFGGENELSAAAPSPPYHLVGVNERGSSKWRFFDPAAAAQQSATRAQSSRFSIALTHSSKLPLSHLKNLTMMSPITLFLSVRRLREREEMGIWINILSIRQNGKS